MLVSRSVGCHVQLSLDYFYLFFFLLFYLFSFSLVASCLRDLRNDAVVFLAGIVRHITSVAVIQQSCESSQPFTACVCVCVCMIIVIMSALSFLYFSVIQFPKTAVSSL